MQRLAQAGNGNAAHIDSLLEARKAMSEELASTLFSIADDVKVQVEFNPAQIAEYRLIGYETRMLRREDFKDDKVDAGDIGAGHTVTAIYELTPVGARQRQVDPLRYQPERDGNTPRTRGGSDELAFVKLRYKLPGESTSRLIDQPIRAADRMMRTPSSALPSPSPRSPSGCAARARLRDLATPISPSSRIPRAAPILKVTARNLSDWCVWPKRWAPSRSAEGVDENLLTAGDIKYR